MRRRAPALAALAAVVVAAAALAWWFDLRTRPDQVGPRFVDAVVHRHPGTTVEPLDGGFLRVSLPSGVRVDVALSRVFASCEATATRCTDAIGHAADDVDASDAATRAPDRASLRPTIVAEGAGYRYGFVADPLIGAYEVRYALVHGVASTFVTASIAASLGLSPQALRETAIANLAGDRDVGIEPVGGDVRGVYRVRADDDPVASLLDDTRMARFADAIGARRLYAAIPSRGTLALAARNPASARALDALAAKLRTGTRAPSGGLLAYDLDAPAGSHLTSAVAATP